MRSMPAANAVKTGNANIDPGVANDVVAAQNHLDTTGTLPTEYPALVQQLHQNANGLPPHAANAVVAAANVVGGNGADVPSVTPISMQPSANNTVTKAINSAANSVRNGSANISPETANQVLNAQDQLKSTGLTPTNHPQIISNLQNESRNLPPHVVSAVNKAATDIGLPPTYAPAPNNTNGAVSNAISSAANAIANGSAPVSNNTANKVLTANAYLNKNGVPPVNPSSSDRRPAARIPQPAGRCRQQGGRCIGQDRKLYQSAAASDVDQYTCELFRHVSRRRRCAQSPRDFGQRTGSREPASASSQPSESQRPPLKSAIVRYTDLN